MAERIGKENFQEKVQKSELPVLVEFYSDTCIPCKQLSPVLGAVEEERERKLRVYKVNVNYDLELAEQYGVLGVPALRLLIGGQVRGEQNRFIKKEELDNWLNQLL